jgi:transposase
MPYSVDLRERVVRLHKTGEWTTRELEDLLGPAHTTVARWVRLEAATGKVADPPSNRGRAPKISPERLQVVRELVEAKADAQLRELAQSYQERTGDAVSEPTMCRALQRLGITRKKRASTRRSVIDQT